MHDFIARRKRQRFHKNFEGVNLWDTGLFSHCHWTWKAEKRNIFSYFDWKSRNMQNLIANDLYLFIGCESGSSNLIKTWCLNSISKPGYCQWGHITSSIQEVPRRHVFWRKNNQFIQKFKVSLEERRCMVSFLLFSIYQLYSNTNIT